jgi:short subunit dehydrogenase-like uncharacterized protein
MAHLMIYGCTGYTAQLILQKAKSIDLNLIVAGRTEGKVKAIASQFDMPYRVFDLQDTQRIDTALKNVKVLLNCSGPFRDTAEPLMRACIRNGTHYVDIAAELDSYELATELDQEASDAKVLLMPGCGGSVAMLGCLARYALGDDKTPTSIDIALHVAGPMSRGSVVSAAAGLTSQCLKRTQGALTEQDQSIVQNFDFGDGKGSVACFPVTLPDLITIWKSTSVPHIQTFVHVSADENGFPSGDMQDIPDGPTEEQREANPYHASVVVTCEDGSVKEAVLHTVNGYSFTAQASLEAARRILEGVNATGFQTPADVFGMRFVDSVAGSVMEMRGGNGASAEALLRAADFGTKAVDVHSR